MKFSNFVLGVVSVSPGGSTKSIGVVLSLVSCLFFCTLVILACTLFISLAFPLPLTLLFLMFVVISGLSYLLMIPEGFLL